MINRFLAWTAALAFGLGLPCGAVSAQDWPSRTIRIVVPLAAGSSTDVMARLIAERISPALGQPVIVENRTGAGGMLGARHVAQSDPDGHTLLIGNVATHAISPAVRSDVPYDAVADFEPVVAVVTGPNIVVANPHLGIATIQELVAAAKEQPGEFYFGSVGPGTGSHLCAELLKMLAGIDAFHVPYKSPVDALNAVMRGEIAFTIQSFTSAIPMVRAGRLRGLAVTSRQRSPAAPDIPSVAESGYPDYEFTTWAGILAPAGTPNAIVERLNGEIRKVLDDPALRGRMENLGATVAAGTPDEFATFIKSEIARWKKVSLVAGVRIN